VDVSVAKDDGGLLAVKLQTAACELNFRASLDDLRQLGMIDGADWEQRKSLHVGESSGAPVFWAKADAGAILMVGADDETWDIALTVPSQALEEIARMSQNAD
jgi:hypothetical protein